MAQELGRFAAALRKGQLVEIPNSQSQVLPKAELGRQQWERSLRLLESDPDDYDFQIEKAYDSLVVLCEALIAAHGYRRKNPTHGFLLEVGVELLNPFSPEQAAHLEAIREHLRRERNELKYDRYRVVNRGERDQVLGALAPILKAIELAVFTKIGRPPPGHSWQDPIMPGEAGHDGGA